jgi:hypothetical protein
MRLPYPKRISYKWAGLAVTLLAVIQLFLGTSAVFTLLSSGYIMAAVAAFNVGGGLTRPSGAFVFFNASQGAILGLVWKARLGEAADTNLSGVANLAIGLYLIGMCGLLLSVSISRIFSRSRGWLADVAPVTSLYRSAIGCLMIGIAIPLMATLLAGAGSQILGSILAQLNRFVVLALVFAIMHEVKVSGGTRSMNAVSWIAMIYIFQGGIFNFSKEGIFLPLLCWGATVAALRYRITRAQLLGLVLATTFAVMYLVPYSQYGRNFRESQLGRFTVVKTLLLHLPDIRADALGIRRYAGPDNSFAGDEPSDPTELGFGNYFNSRQGLVERLQTLSMDATLISVTKDRGPIGYLPIQIAILNVIPHFIWPDKPSFNTGNEYGHAVGVLADDDMTTDIAFSAVADIYHEGGIYGLISIAPLIWTLVFLIFDSICGDVYSSPWGLIAVTAFAHIAPEASLTYLVYTASTGFIATLFLAFFSTRIVPIFADLIVGPPRERGVRRLPRPAPARN